MFFINILFIWWLWIYMFGAIYLIRDKFAPMVSLTTYWLTLTIQYIRKNRRFLTIFPKISSERYFFTWYRFHSLGYVIYHQYIVKFSSVVTDMTMELVYLQHPVELLGNSDKDWGWAGKPTIFITHLTFWCLFTSIERNY